MAMRTGDAALPRTPAELEELLGDNKRVAEAFGDPASAKAFIQGYADLASKHDPDIEGQVQEQVAKTMGDLLQQSLQRNGIQAGNGVRPPMDEMDNGKHHSRMAPGEPLNGKFKSFGEFLRVAHHDTIDTDGVRLQLKALGEGQGDQGGFLVPEEFRNELLRLSVEQAVVRPRARVIPMTRLTLRLPAIRDASHASNVYGGVSATWEPEAGSVTTATEPTFAQVVLTAQKLRGYTIVSNELLEDSAIALEALLMQLFRDAIIYFEDDAFINGVGGGGPLGILNADALITVAKETGQAATTIVWENIIKMFSRMLPQSIGNAVWVAHQDTIPQLTTLSLAVGTGGSAMWLQNGQGGLPQTLLGRPIVYTEKCQTLGTAGDLYFVDFSHYLIGDRQALTVASSPHVRFTTDETVWKFIHRVTGKPWLDTALTPRNGSNTVSPFVDLATRS